MLWILYETLSNVYPLYPRNSFTTKCSENFSRILRKKFDHALWEKRVYVMCQWLNDYLLRSWLSSWKLGFHLIFKSKKCWLDESGRNFYTHGKLTPTLTKFFIWPKIEYGPWKECKWLELQDEGTRLCRSKYLTFTHLNICISISISFRIRTFRVEYI